MKKISILGLCLVAGFTASAQTSLVKEVERGMKSSIGEYPKLVEQLKPAMTNPETKDDAFTWFVAGKGGFDFFDNQQAMMQIGKDVNKKNVGHALIDGYNCLITALPLDSLPNEKGKIKPKYSKDIIKLINSHYYDFNNAGIYLWEAQDYKGAYDAWELLFDIPVNKLLGINAPQAYPDSTLCDIAYNQALAAWQFEDFNAALAAFDKAIKYGYNKKNVYDYAISVAYQMQDNGKMAYYASLAYPLYGAEDNRYIGYMINDKIQNKQFDEAQTMLEKYIADDPDNGQLYYVLGVLYENKNDNATALEQYRKAVQLDSKNAQAYLQLGRMTYNLAVQKDEEANTLSNAEYNKARTEIVDPILREAASYLEKAYELDPENMHDALANLRTIYYNLNDAENLDRIEKLQ